MTGRPTDLGKGVERATALGFMLLGWLGAEALILGMVERVSGLTGSELLHRHTNADAVAVVLIVGMAAAPLGAAVRAGLWHDAARALDSRLGAMRVMPALLAALLLAAAETSELALLAHHHAWPVVTLLVLAAFLQGGAALAAAFAWSAVVRLIVRCRALSDPVTQRLGRARAEVAARAYGLQPVHWIGRLTPERAPPALPAH